MQCSRLAALPASSTRSSRVKVVGSAVHTPCSIFFAYSLASFLRYFIAGSAWLVGQAHSIAKNAIRGIIGATWRSPERVAKRKKSAGTRRKAAAKRQGAIDTHAHWYPREL